MCLFMDLWLGLLAGGGLASAGVVELLRAPAETPITRGMAVADPDRRP